MTVIDCVSPPPVDAMRAAGVTGLCRYLSLPQSNTVWKRITQAEYDSLLAAGFDVLLNWEYAATDWLGGAAAGTSHAAESVKQAKALGYPLGCAIVGSADFNMTQTQWQTAGRMYALAFSTGLRAAGYKAGVYGPWDVLGWCKDMGTFDVYWQAGMSTSWSSGRNAQVWPGAHLRQRKQTFIGGVDCDLNDVLQVNYGQAGGDVALSDKQYQEIVQGGVDDDNVLHWRLRGIQDQDDEAIAATKLGRPATPGLKQIAEKLDGLTAGGAPTQEQVDAAVEKVLPNALAAALADPATMADLGAAIVQAFKKS